MGSSDEEEERDLERKLRKLRVSVKAARGRKILGTDSSKATGDGDSRCNRPSRGLNTELRPAKRLGEEGFSR